MYVRGTGACCAGRGSGLLGLAADRHVPGWSAAGTGRAAGHGLALDVLVVAVLGTLLTPESVRPGAVQAGYVVAVLVAVMGRRTLAA